MPSFLQQGRKIGSDVSGTADYDDRYGATSGFWTTGMFVEAVYKSLSEKVGRVP